MVTWWWRKAHLQKKGRWKGHEHDASTHSPAKRNTAQPENILTFSHGYLCILKESCEQKLSGRDCSQICFVGDRFGWGRQRQGAVNFISLKEEQGVVAPISPTGTSTRCLVWQDKHTQSYTENTVSVHTQKSIIKWFIPSPCYSWGNISNELNILQRLHKPLMCFVSSVNMCGEIRISFRCL